MSLVKEPIAGVVYPSREDVNEYDRLGIFTDETMAEAFRALVRRFPDCPALRDRSSSLTFAELDLRTDLIGAGLLRTGLKPNDRVIFQLLNGPELVILFLACLKAGLIPVCTLAAHRKAEIGFLAAHSSARAHIIHGDAKKFDFVALSRDVREELPDMALTIFATGEGDGDGHVKTLADLTDCLSRDEALDILSRVPRDPAQVAVFQLSGGTSGTPKIIPRFHNEYLYQIRTTAAFHGIDETTVAFSPAPMMHNAPIVCYWGSVLWSGGCVVCSAEMDPGAFARTIEACRPNWMAIPLPLLVKMHNEGVLVREHFKGARLSTAGNAPRIAELTGAVTLPLYGMTEGIICYGKPGDPDVVWRKMVGRPVSTLDDFRVIDPVTEETLLLGQQGEFCFKGPCSTRGYFDAPERNAEAFTKDGYVKSGDLMSLHEIDGTVFLKFEGRVKDVVSRGGEKINCLEIEQHLIRHPSIGAIAIVPMPDPDYGEKACAFVIPVEGQDAPSVKEAGTFLEAAGVAKFKWPERIETVDAFPQTSSGKLSKPLLRELAAGLASAPLPEKATA